MKRGKRSPLDRVKEELRGSIVEAVLDAARERRKDGDMQSQAQSLFLAHNATHHALNLADQYLTLEDE